MQKGAIEAFKQAIRIKPDLADAHFNLGIIYLTLNAKGYALEEYKILKDFNPEMADDFFGVIYKESMSQSEIKLGFKKENKLLHA
jgi:tetratricopeptide (TPR) repeat protein